MAWRLRSSLYPLWLIRLRAHWLHHLDCDRAAYFWLDALRLPRLGYRADGHQSLDCGPENCRACCYYVQLLPLTVGEQPRNCLG